MLLRSAISPRLPPFQPRPTPSSTSYSKVSLGFRLDAAILRLGWRSGCPTRCSIPRVNGNDVVGYEQTSEPTWMVLIGRITAQEDPSAQAGVVLDAWESEEGRRLSKEELHRVIREMRDFRKYKLALEVFNWMAEQGNRFTLDSYDVAIQLDLIAKACGTSHAEEHFLKLPDTLKGKSAYVALLYIYGQAKMKDEAEAMMDTIKNKGYATNVHPFNAMMALYTSVGEHEKVTMVINEMKEKNLTFNAHTYLNWISNCTAMRDVEEMERVVGEMISDSKITANWSTFTTIASMYTKLGNFEKAASCLKDAETRMTGCDRAPLLNLIHQYGQIGKREELYRVWNWYKLSHSAIPDEGSAILDEEGSAIPDEGSDEEDEEGPAILDEEDELDEEGPAILDEEGSAILDEEDEEGPAILDEEDEEDEEGPAILDEEGPAILDEGPAIEDEEGYRIMLSSLTRLGDIDGAEVIYKEWVSTTSIYDARICHSLVSLYIREGLVGKAKDVLDGFLEKGGKPSPITWELLAEGYIKEKQLSEALLSIKAAAAAAVAAEVGINNWKPKPTNITILLEFCMEKNDMDSVDMLTTLLSDKRTGKFE